MSNARPADRPLPMGTYESLASLDGFQGADGELLKLRERCPEPSRWQGQQIRMPLPRERMFNPWTIDFVKVTGFEKVRMICNGTVFMAWKSTDDGKVYF